PGSGRVSCIATTSKSGLQARMGRFSYFRCTKHDLTPPLLPVHIKTLGPTDAAVLDNLAPDVSDHPPRAGLTREFLSDPRHHIVVAIDDGAVVGMATGVHYVHPDKPAELFINEVGVATGHRRAGVGR